MEGSIDVLKSHIIYTISEFEDVLAKMLVDPDSSEDHILGIKERIATFITLLNLCETMKLKGSDDKDYYKQLLDIFHSELEEDI